MSCGVASLGQPDGEQRSSGARTTAARSSWSSHVIPPEACEPRGEDQAPVAVISGVTPCHHLP